MLGDPRHRREEGAADERRKRARRLGKAFAEHRLLCRRVYAQGNNDKEDENEQFINGATPVATCKPQFFSVRGEGEGILIYVIIRRVQFDI